MGEGGSILMFLQKLSDRQPNDCVDFPLRSSTLKLHRSVLQCSFKAPSVRESPYTTQCTQPQSILCSRGGLLAEEGSGLPVLPYTGIEDSLLRKDQDYLYSHIQV